MRNKLEGFGEFENNFFSGQFFVDITEGLQFVFDISLHGFVEVDLEMQIRTSSRFMIPSRISDFRHSNQTCIKDGVP